MVMNSSISPPDADATSVNNISANTGSNVWGEVLNQASKQLTAKDIQKLKSIANYDDFSRDLESQVRSFSESSRIHRILKKLSKPLNQLKSLSEAISIISQYQGTAACLIWGSLMIVIDVRPAKIFVVVLAKLIPWCRFLYDS